MRDTKENTMALRETQRQLVAGGSATAGFLATYFALNLEWFASLPLALVIYVALVMIIPRKKESNEIEVDAGLTQADVDAAVAYCITSAKELKRLGEGCTNDRELSATFASLAGLTEDIAKNYAKDPQDLRHSRGFVDHHLPKLIEIGRVYDGLRSQRLTSAAEQRLVHSRNEVLEFVPRFEAILNACLENDFQRLETETEALGQIMTAEAPAPMTVIEPKRKT